MVHVIPSLSEVDLLRYLSLIPFFLFFFLYRHFQKPGFNFTLTEVSDWAKRPLSGQEIFIIGDAYNPYRGWTEGAIFSANNALLEGWAIQEMSSLQGKNNLEVAWRELLLDSSKDLQSH